jgi:hypothetical protein
LRSSSSVGSSFSFSLAAFGGAPSGACPTSLAFVMATRTDSATQSPSSWSYGAFRRIASRTFHSGSSMSLSLVGRAGFIFPIYRRFEIDYAPVLELDPDSILGVCDTRNLTFATDLLHLAAMAQAMNPYDPTHFGNLLTPLGDGGKGGNAGDEIIISPGILPGRRSGILRVSQLDVVCHPQPISLNRIIF